jgi:hypothetical protein
LCDEEPPIRSHFRGEQWEGVLGVYKITVIAARWAHFGGGWEGQMCGMEKNKIKIMNFLKIT